MKNTENPALSFRAAMRGGFAAFQAAFFPLMAFEVVYRAATALAVKPLMAFVVQLLLRFAGDDLAFNSEIWRFALTLPGILAALLLAALAVFFIYFEFAVVIALAAQALAGQAVSVKSAIIRALWGLPCLKGPGVLLFALYALVLLPVVNMGVTSALLPALSIPNFITGELAKTPFGQWALLGAAVLGFILFFCLLFVLPAMALERCRFLPAVRRSLRTIGAYRFKTLGLVLVFLAAWLVLFLLPRQLFEFAFGVPSVTLGQALRHYGFSLLTPVMLLIWVVVSGVQLILMPLLLALLTACTLPLASPVAPDEAAAEAIRARLDWLTGWLQKIVLAVARTLRRGWRWLMARPFVHRHRRGLGVVLALVVVWVVARSLMSVAGVHDPIVIGHRGSAEGVENTLEAIGQAIAAGADYAEVDVLLSSDGVPMVVHDTNLKRLSGRDVNVYDLTAEELQQIPLSQNGYTGRIPTLAQVVEYCEGKILLAVEYKLHGREEKDLIAQTMAVMKTSAYQKNSLYLSLDYGLVAGMKEQYPAYRTGYCVYGNVGQLTAQSLREMNIDFLLVEEWMVSRNLTDACRKAWVPVYVWTVNDPEKMADYLQLGVVGLVTDWPDAALEVLAGMVDLSHRQLPVAESEQAALWLS